MPEINNWMLILDTCAVHDWPKLANRCCVMGGRSILLVPRRWWTREEESRFIYLGIYGIVLMSKIEDELLPAVRSVEQDRLWIGREALSAYVKQTRSFGNVVESRIFTTREQQIIPFLMTGSSNKDIANVLQISDRTVKFHVSNILQKLRVKNRKALWEARREKAEAPLTSAASA